MLATELIQELEEMVKSFGDREVRLFADDMPELNDITISEDDLEVETSNGDRAPIYLGHIEP